MRLECSNLEAVGDKGAEIVSLAIKDRGCKNNNGIHAQHTHTHTHTHHTRTHTYTLPETRHTHAYARAGGASRKAMQLDSSETVSVESTHASLLRRLMGNAPPPEEAPPMPDIGSASVQPQGQAVTHASAYSLPIHCLFTAYSLPIHCLFTAYSLPTHCH
jgi:hypothetical protein